MIDAIDFLLFSYFSISSTDDIDQIVDSAIEKAYLDAVQQGAFNTMLNKNNRDQARTAHNNCTKLIKKRVAEVLRFEINAEQYDSWHNMLCKDLLSQYKDVGIGFFEYGNAQKWVNMTMKYLFIIETVLETGSLSAIIQLSDVLHVPVDSYIIQNVWEDTDIVLPIIKTLKDGSRGTYSSGKITSWSKWKENEYIDFKESMKHKEPLPFAWEGPAWIAQAKKIKRKHQS